MKGPLHMTTATQPTQTAQIKVNAGEALLHLAGFYPTLLEVVLELVQNALDVDVKAKKIWIRIDYRARRIFVRDNGRGTSVEQFDRALATVATRERKGKDSLGQFGIGLISPLGKCAMFTFASCPTPMRDGYKQWTFESEKIARQGDNILIPVTNRDDLIFEANRGGHTRVAWRSEVSLHDITTDATISRITMETLVSAILDRYNATMRKMGTIVQIDIVDSDGRQHTRDNITAVEFRGVPLEEIVLGGEPKGRTTFRLYISPITSNGRKGRVLMGVEGKDFRFPAHYFVRFAVGLLPEEVVTALTSGLLEGEIISQKARLSANRQAFEKDDNLVELCVAIEVWYKTHGKKHVEDARDTRREERFQTLGLRSMKVLEQLLRDPANSALLSVVRSFGNGTVGKGHTEPDEVSGEQGIPSLAVGNPKSGDADSGPHRDPRKDKPRHIPLSVQGPEGKPRRTVKGSSLGLQFAHEAMEGSQDLWKLDVVQGILIFNIRHPHWIACDVNDSKIMRLQEVIAMQALTLETMPDGAQRKCQRQVLDELNYSMVYWILNADKARGS